MFKIRNMLARQCMAEFLGTMLLVVVGDGSVAQYVLSGKKDGPLGINFLSVNVAWGVAVAMGVYVSAGVSGGHINPAVSLAMTLLRKISVAQLFVYMAAQYLAAIAGSAIVFGVYKNALDKFDGGVRATEGPNATAGIWSTFPEAFLNVGVAFADQVVGTAILLVCVMAITDSKNSGAPAGVVPLAVGTAVIGIGTSFGFNCGYAINPARDMGPRIFTAMAGWGSDPFTFRNHNWFWVPWVAPHVGAIVGVFLYLLLVGMHHPDDDDDEPDTARNELNGKDNEGFHTYEQQMSQSL